MSFRNSVSIALLMLALAMCAFGQTATPPAASTPLANVTLPTYIMAGGSYNQFTGGSGFVSAIVPESDKVGLYGSVTADIAPAKIVDPVTGKTGYGLSPNIRAGQHKVAYQDPKNVVLIGGDFGASFAQTGSPAGINIGLAGSFTVTYVRQLSARWACGVPVRMLWMSGIGPGGAGVWNPVAEVGIIFKP